MYLVLTYWLLWPYEPITINSIDIMNEDNIAYIGEDLIYETHYTKDTSYPVVKVTRQLVDGCVYVLKSGKISRLPVGDNKVFVSVKIPDNAKPGMYMFHLTAEYNVNPLRTVTVVARSKPFMVKEKRLRDRI